MTGQTRLSKFTSPPIKISRVKKSKSMEHWWTLNEYISNCFGFPPADTICTNSGWPAAKKQEDLVLLRNNQNEGKTTVRICRLSPTRFHLEDTHRQATAA